LCFCENLCFFKLDFFGQLFWYKIPCFHSSIGDPFFGGQVVEIVVDCLKDISNFDYLCDENKKSKDLKMDTSPSSNCFQSIVEVEVRLYSTTFWV
jgi:hypothetical protein